MCVGGTLIMLLCTCKEQRKLQRLRRKASRLSPDELRQIVAWKDPGIALEPTTPSTAAVTAQVWGAEAICQLEDKKNEELPPDTQPEDLAQENMQEEPVDREEQ